jgi:HPr kinase/phosphorylase
MAQAGDSAAAGPAVLHASAVAWEGRGLLILGPSGSGKSTLALALMALGCDLVADDRTALRRDGRAILADCPEPIRGMIEARGLGLLRAAPAGEVPLALVADLSQAETERLPPPREVALLGIRLPCVHKIEIVRFAPALVQYLKWGRSAP